MPWTRYLLFFTLTSFCVLCSPHIAWDQGGNNRNYKVNSGYYKNSVLILHKIHAVNIPILLVHTCQCMECWLYKSFMCCTCKMYLKFDINKFTGQYVTSCNWYWYSSFGCMLNHVQLVASPAFNVISHNKLIFSSIQMDIFSEVVTCRGWCMEINIKIIFPKLGITGTAHFYLTWVSLAFLPLNFPGRDKRLSLLQSIQAGCGAHPSSCLGGVLSLADTQPGHADEYSHQVPGLRFLDLYHHSPIWFYSLDGMAHDSTHVILPTAFQL
jgi:hypothetical protein